MVGFQLKVTTEQLKNTSTTVFNLIRETKSAFEDLGRAVSKTSQYWIGEAGDRHRQLWQEQWQEVEAMLRRLEEYPEDLLAMAGLYEKAESEVTKTSAALRGDVIS